MTDLASKLSLSKHRIELLKGLIAYRKALRASGIRGFQWIDGSFVEHKEKRVKPGIPSDIDVLTFISTQFSPESKEFIDFQNSIKYLFDVVNTKLLYKCDAYPMFLFENLGANPADIVVYMVNQTHYWYGLFSHSKIGERWKGMLAVPLDSPDDDNSVLASLERAAGGSI